MEANRSEIVILSFLQLASLVPAEGSVIVGLEVLLIQLDRLGVVRDGRFEVAQFTEGEASVVVEIGLARFYLDGSREALDGLFVVAPPVQ